MALVYRAIPILSTTLLRKKQIGERNISLEEYFYDLGFIDFENSAPFYRISEDSCSTFKYPEEETKAFFLFPFDAVSATLQSVNKKFYHHHEWKILEYDIPDDILTEYCGYGFYDGETKIEFRIPISEFKKWANPAHTIDINVLHKMITESVKKAIDEYKINEVDHKIADIISDELEEITKTCIDATREYFDCPFITNNNHLIKRNDLIYKNERYLYYHEILSYLERKNIPVNDNMIGLHKLFEHDSDDIYYQYRTSSEEYFKTNLCERLEEVLSKIKKVK